MIPSYPFGFDYGNAETCGYLIENGGMKRAKVIPSATALGSLNILATKRGAVGDTYDRDVDALHSDEYVIEINGSEFFVGALALNEAKASSTGRGDINRYWSSKALAVLLTVSGEMIASSDYELYLVAGLPVETFTKENRGKVRDALEGEHQFTLKGKKRRAIIHVVRVVMEGAGAMIAYGKNEPVLQGVIDIGGRTTDLYVAEGQKPIGELCQGKPVGVETVGDLLSQKFSASFQRPLRPKDIHGLLRAYLGQSSYPLLSAHGSEISDTILRKWVDTTVENVAGDIVSFISTTWSSSERGAVAADIAPVLLIGGGAYYFSKFIRERIPHATLPMRPETANAEGYTTLAQVLMSRYRAIA